MTMPVTILFLAAIVLGFALKKERTQVARAREQVARARELDGTPIKLETVPDGLYTFIGSFQDRMFLRDMYNRIIDVPAPDWFVKLPVNLSFVGGEYRESIMG